jgi:tripartite-type tricarboxylate transporter receptor subunit TctC
MTVQTTRRTMLGAGLGLLAAPVIGRAQVAAWKPSRSINLIVPWAAGGSTDQVTRVVAAELEGPLGQSIVIINQPGASGAIGTKSALDATRDGYTWTSGAVQDLGAYETLGSVKARITDWNLFLSVANVPVLAVNPKQPYQTAAELIEGMKNKPGAITVATAGVTSAGHAAMDMVANAGKVTYRNVTYDGGNPAVVATVAGETVATSQVASDEAEMIRGKLLRPLAAIGDKPVSLEGFGIIPPLSDTIKGFTAPANYFGIFVPNGVPDEVIATLQAIWRDTIANSAKLKAYAARNGALFGPISGSEAQKLAFPAVQANAWQLFKSGKAKVSPATVGIPAPPA